MKLLFKIIFWFETFGLSAQTQQPAYKWTEAIRCDGDIYDSFIATDASGYIYNTGSFTGTIDLNPGPGTFTATAPQYNDHSFVNKLDSLGNFVWGVTIGNNTDDCITKSITTDASNNIYVCGYFYGTVDFDPGIGNYPLTPFGSPDIFILKLNSQGNFVWAKQLGGSSAGFSYGITVDGNGNIYTTGLFSGTLDFDPGIASYPLTAGNISGFICKLDAQGNFIWAKQLNGSNAQCAAIKSDASGNTYITGGFSGVVDFDPGINSYILSASTNLSAIFILRLDPQGNFVWCKQVADGTTPTYAFSIALDFNDNVYTAGKFQGTIDFDPGVNSFTLTSGSAAVGNGFILKLDSLGNFIWVRELATSTICEIASIITNIYGSIFVTGNFAGTVDFDPGPDLDTLYSPATVAFVSKLNFAGNFEWAKQMAQPPNEGGNSVGISLAVYNDNLYVEGLFDGIIDFNPGPSSFTLNTNSNSFDVFIQRLKTCDDFNSAIMVSSSASVICSGASVTLTASGLTTYSWSTGTISPTIVVSPQTTNTYSVYSSKNDGCQNYASLTVSVNVCTGIIQGTTTNLNVNAYPNPASNLITIESELELQEIFIMDSYGQILRKSKDIVQPITFDLEGFCPGIYFIKTIEKSGGESVTKMVKD